MRIKGKVMKISSSELEIELSIAPSGVRGKSVKNLITGSVYETGEYEEVVVCWRRRGSALSKKRFVCASSCRAEERADGYLLKAEGMSVEVTFRIEGGLIKKSAAISCESDVFIEYVAFGGGRADGKFSWCAPLTKRVYVPSPIAAMGQPVYSGDLFFGMESPVAENTILGGRICMKYHTGRYFSEVADGGVYRLPSVVVGAGEKAGFKEMRRAFFAYVRTFSRPEKFRIQFNSWYDNMLDIDPKNIESSFTAVYEGFKKAGLRPLDCYVVDDGWTEYEKPLFWQFNQKFKDGFGAQAELTRSFGSSFGVWFGPRGGYTTQTPKYARLLGKIGYPMNVLSGDICTGDKKYIADLCARMADFCRDYNVKYFKIDGFAIKPCRARGHRHPAAKGCGKAFYTFLWEEWCKGFEHIRSVCPDVCLNITSYAHCSPWFLKWADYVWMNNASDMYYIGKGDNLSQCLNYRDERYRDLYEVRQIQFPAAHLYNHEPCYAERNYNPPLPDPSHKTVIYTDEQFALYLKCCMMRASGLAEVYFSPSLMDGDKWNIAARTLEWAEKNCDVLSHSEFFGGDPSKGEVYGYIAAKGDKFILMLRNSGDKAAKYSFTLPGAGKVSGELAPFEIKFSDNLK